NIHVINSSQETENIQMAKEYGFSIAQNADAPTMMELIGSKNFERTKEIINKIDAMAKQREEAMQQQALESNEQVAQMNADTAQAKNDVEIYKADKDYDKVIDAKLLDLGSNVDTAEPAKEVKDTTNLDNHKMNMDKE